MKNLPKYRKSSSSRMSAAQVEWMAAWMERHPSFKAEDLYAEARKATCPIHALYEWDDSTAADTARLDHTRELIRQVEVLRIIDDRPEYFRMAHSVESPRADEHAGTTRRYVILREVERNKTLQDQILERGIEVLIGFLRDFGRKSELFGHVPDAIKELLKEVSRQQRKRGA